MNRLWKLALILGVLIAIGISGFYLYLPVKRVDVTSDLIMLGDLNGDREWDGKDKTRLAAVLAKPFQCDTVLFHLIDVNRNDSIDSEDLAILERLYRFTDPYTALEQAHDDGVPFPRPRELFRYLPRTEYVSRPVFTLPHEVSRRSPLKFLRAFRINDQGTAYEHRLLQEIYDEALRFSFAWEQREPGLTDRERTYAESKLATCDSMYDEERFFDLLLHLVGLVEDAETLTVIGQSEFVRQILFFRENLQEILVSEEFRAFERGERTHKDTFKRIEVYLQNDLGIELNLDELESPRGFLDLQNYLDRVWRNCPV